MIQRFGRSAVAATGLGAALVIALSVATMLGWSMTVRLGIVVGLLVIGLVLLLVQSIRAERNAKGIEEAMQTQAEAQQKGARPDRQGEIRQLQEQFDRALKTLKESKLDRGGRGSTALYALPWYLFVGPPASGKTTAIAHSGLRFPLGTNRVRGVGGTRNCDWFFADSAIILDTAGRYMIEDQDAEEWHAFLAALRKHRKHQPINGVLVGMSAAELAQMSSSDLSLHAEAFRQRLDELVRLLGVRFPVYLVFTKCDLLGGFVEFFGDLTKVEREQVWGATLELDDPRQPAEAFAEEFEALSDVLLDERLSRLVRPMKREERQAVYAFPLEVEVLKDRLAAFVDELFLPNPYQDTPHFRGFYFTSGTQEGAPIDRVISAVAEELGLPPQPAGAAHFDAETKAYFLKDLFTDVVIPDQHIVRSTKKRSAVPLAAILSGVGLLLFALLLLWSGWQSRADIRGVETAAVALGEETRGDAGAVVVRLADLEGAVTEARDGGWRLYNRDRLLGPADRLWLERTRAFLSEHGVEVLEQRLAGADVGAEGAVWQRLYEDLQTYLLLSDEASRLAGEEGEANRALVAGHLETVARADGVAPPEPTALPRLFEAYLVALGEGRVAPFRADPTLVRRAQAVLSRAPGVELSYNRILQEAAPRFEDLTPTAMAGSGASVFAGEPAVPGVFTQAAWEGSIRDAIAERSRQPDHADWVVGRVEGLALTQEQAGNAEARLRRRYFADYAEAWEQFLGDLRYVSAPTVEASAERLAILGDARSSPLLLVLARTADETDFSRPEEGAAPEGPPGASPEPVQVESGAEGVAQRFAWLHALHPELAASGGAAPELTAALLAMADLSAELEGGGGEERLVTYQMAARRVPMAPDLRERLFESPMEAGGAAAEAAAASAAAAALNDQWGEAYGFFRERLSGRYPFDPASDQDALLEDVDAFFNPSGGLAAPFLEPREDEELLSASARSTLDRVRAISRTLFDRGELGVDFELQPELPEKSPEAPPVVEYVLNLLGQTNVYQMGAPPVIRSRWPDRSGALLKVQTSDGTLELDAEGDWAVFRLFGQAEVRRRASREYVLAWPMRTSGGHTIRPRYLLTTQADPRLVQDPSSFLALRLPSRLSR